MNLVEFPDTQVGNDPDTGAPAISIDWQDDDSLDIALNRIWNTIKNIEISDFTGSALRISNFVDAWAHLYGDADRNIAIDGVKRAEVMTGGGATMSGSASTATRPTQGSSGTAPLVHLTI